MIGKDPADGQFFAQVDGNGDGRFDGEGEGPLKTGASVRLGDRLCALDLDAEDKQRGQALWLCFPAAETVRERLDRHRKTAGDAVQTLCLVGWPTAVPMAVISNGQGIDTDLVSDLPYGQTDEDAFLELGLARFLAEDLPSATLQACRGLVRDRFPDQKWRGRFATAEWGAPLRLPFEAQGWTYAGHHDGPAGIGAPSPLTGCEVLLHASHASWLGMGATYPGTQRRSLRPPSCSLRAAAPRPSTRTASGDRWRRGCCATEPWRLSAMHAGASHNSGSMRASFGTPLRKGPISAKPIARPAMACWSPCWSAASNAEAATSINSATNRPMAIPP
ncbi:MAG: hypothetical protein R3E96_03915 [Planctomycetota bacterium]